MTLPNLPKKHKKPEADFGTKISKYINELKEPLFKYSVWIEAKVCKNDNLFYFIQLEEHQIKRCLDIKYKGTMVRISMATVNGLSGVPDYAWVYKQPAYVLIKYNNNMCYFIDIDTFLLEKNKNKRASLTEARANEICILSVKYKNK